MIPIDLENVEAYDNEVGKEEKIEVKKIGVKEIKRENFRIHFIIIDFLDVKVDFVINLIKKNSSKKNKKSKIVEQFMRD